jgi:hypothetical protein
LDQLYSVDNRLGSDDDFRFVEQITRHFGRANPRFRSREPGAEL